MPAHALEADQYLIFEKEEGLKDSSDQINQMLNKDLDDFMARFINVRTTRKKPQACEKIAFRFLRYIRPHFFQDRMKSAIMKDKEIDKYPKESKMFRDYGNSIYQGFRFPFIMPVAQNLNVNGVYLGTDKIDHFFSSGRRYYSKYQAARKKGLSHIDGLKKALKFGLSIIEEKGILGYWTSGAFSYADIESNYQGMMMGIDMCQGETPNLKYNEETKRWDVQRRLDIKEYVNPLWDEAFNNSYYFKYRWNGVKKVLKEKYCELGLKPHVQKLWKSYHKTSKPAFHTDYLRGLIHAGKIPDPRPQRLHEACGYEEGVMEGVSFWDNQHNEGESDLHFKSK